MVNSINKKRFSFIGSMIREYRFCRGLSQFELANLSDIHVNTLKRIENSKGNVTIVKLFQLADALELDIRDLLPDDDENKRIKI